MLICFESAFPDMSRVDAQRGAQLIVYQTSDSTFQGSWAPAQHASLGALRAAETGRPAVQAALTGDSAAFDAQGRLLASMGTAQRGLLTVRLGLEPGTALTPFDRYGMWSRGRLSGSPCWLPRPGWRTWRQAGTDNVGSEPWGY